ncbi:WhiB family transcriptional regulator [Mycobacterium kiyosense]|uniref:WhiB family transcriptional regulator n=2 Tax=Mycobacterium kiyosense TaxID=2871094 RepID=UPI0021746DD3|nr:WhiB family transcriptional regulator [Mycobacterium kiyosense]GLD08885.1 hypothetical protein Mkiyose1383_52110 [Mycobacterium kiyosense]
MNHKTDTSSPSLPCQQNPGDWFDPRRRAFTRRQCLKCANRSDCAAAAIRHRPSYGMWAGVWIDGDLAVKQHLLGLPHPDIGPSLTPQSPDPQPHPPTPPPPAPAGSPRARRARVGKLPTTPPAPAVAALITARASGHCEIMAPACTHQQSAIFTRRRRTARTALTSPADAIAACRNCIDLIEHTDTPTALDLGYLVDPRSTTSTAPMLWRQHRWVYLDTRGRLHPTGGPDLFGIA